ncbi:hypothetical protein FRB98_004681 [Tulasnella sp. 332]|nr:hypothetical protein FRB98_004681 [Tulasnella sp. 332]
MGILASTQKYNPSTDIPNLKGKVILVTGANAGIGYEALAELVYMGARNEGRAVGAISRLKANGYLDGPDAGEVVWLELDLSTPGRTRRAAEEFLKRETRLDILINNAGIGGVPAEAFTTVDDSKIPIGILMSTNHLGPFVLTNALLPLLKKTAAESGSDIRVVTVSSGIHPQCPKMDWKSADGWNPKQTGLFGDLGAYATTKTANILFAKELQRIFDQENVNAVSMSLSPGTVDTESFHSLPSVNWNGFIIYYLSKVTGLLMTPAQGSYTTLFAATSPKARDRRTYGGAYLVPYGKIAEPSKVAKDPVAARDLWETSERVAAAM